MRRSAIILVLAMLVCAAAFAGGCGGGSSGGTAPSTRPAKSSAPLGVRDIDLSGPWIVHGQPDDQYYLSFNMMGTYYMKKAGAAGDQGSYLRNGNTVTLIESSGNRIKLTYVRGPDMNQDRLEGDGLVWTRV